MGKGNQSSPQDLSRMIASVDQLARIRDYLRDSRDVSGTVIQLSALIDDARRAAGQYTAQTPPIAAPTTTATAQVQTAEIKTAVKPQSDTEKYTRLGVDTLHAGGAAVLSAFGLGSVAPAIGGLEQTALNIGFGA